MQTVRVLAEETTAENLKPGDLFSFEPQWYWDYAPDGVPNPKDKPIDEGTLSVGEQVFLRTTAPIPPGHEGEIIYLITIIKE